MPESTAVRTEVPPAPVLRDSPQRWWLAMLLFAGMFLVYAQRGAISVAAPFLSKELHLNPAVTGVVLSAFFWSYCLMQVPSGVLSDRLGPRRVYAAGMLVCAVASMLMGITAGLLTLLLFRIVLGIGQAVGFPATSGIISASFPDRERGTVSAFYLCGVRLGQAAVTALGGYFIPVYGWRALFVIVGIGTFAWVLPWSQFLKSWEPPKSAVRPTTPPITLMNGLRLFRHRSLLGIVLGFFAYDYCWFLYTSWLPAYLTSERHFTPVEMSWFGSVPYLIMSVAIMLSGVTTDALIRRGYRELTVRKTAITIGMLLACFIVPAGLVSDKHVSVLFITVSMCGLGVCVPNAWTITQTVCAKPIVATATGIQNFGGNVGGVIAPALTGYIAYRTHSFAAALSLTGVILVAGIVCYLTLVGERVEA